MRNPAVVPVGFSLYPECTMRYLLLLLTVLPICWLCACEPAPKTSGLKHTMSTDLKRFTVTSYGSFNAGYRGNPREILVIKDTKTGVEYFCVTGVGTTELHTESNGKTTTQKEE